MTTQTYLALIERGDHNYSAFMPDVLGCIAAGDSVADTLSNLQAALASHIALMEADGDPLPSPEWDGAMDSLDPDFQDGDYAAVAAVAVETSGKSVRCNVTLPESLVARIDGYTGGRGRSQFLATAARQFLANA